MIQQLQQTFHSITKSLEVLYVIEDIKQCARILVFEDELNKVIDFITETNAYAFVSDFKVLKQNTQSEFYSDKSTKLPKNPPEKGHFLVYVSKDKEMAEKAKLMEENNKHKELGLLLGYPECCCNFFVNNFDEKNTDLTLKILQNSNGYEFPFYTNIAARHFDVSLLSHFPHSFDCKPSIEIAKNNLKIINKTSQPLVEMFSKVLHSVVIYTIEEGIFLLKKYDKIDNKVIYGDVLTTTKSKLYYLLSSNKAHENQRFSGHRKFKEFSRELNITDKNSFVVSDVNIKGEQYGVMVFS